MDSTFVSVEDPTVTAPPVVASWTPKLSVAISGHHDVDMTPYNETLYWGRAYILGNINYTGGGPLVESMPQDTVSIMNSSITNTVPRAPIGEHTTFLRSWYPTATKVFDAVLDFGILNKTCGKWNNATCHTWTCKPGLPVNNTCKNGTAPTKCDPKAVKPEFCANKDACPASGVCPTNSTCSLLNNKTCATWLSPTGSGSGNDTGAIQACVNAAGTAGNGAVCYLRPGSYIVYNTIMLAGSRTNFTLEGAGFRTQVTKRAANATLDPAAANGSLFEIVSGDVTIRQMQPISSEPGSPVVYMGKGSTSKRTARLDYMLVREAPMTGGWAECPANIKDPKDHPSGLCVCE